jgi:hypothetical protein
MGQGKQKMNIKATKFIRRICNMLQTPDARVAAAKGLRAAWLTANHRQRGKLKKLMESRIAQQAKAQAQTAGT